MPRSFRTQISSQRRRYNRFHRHDRRTNITADFDNHATYRHWRWPWYRNRLHRKRKTTPRPSLQHRSGHRGLCVAPATTQRWLCDWAQSDTGWPPMMSRCPSGYSSRCPLLSWQLNWSPMSCTRLVWTAPWSAIRTRPGQRDSCRPLSRATWWSTAYFRWAT